MLKKIKKKHTFYVEIGSSPDQLERYLPKMYLFGLVLKSFKFYFYESAREKTLWRAVLLFCVSILLYVGSFGIPNPFPNRALLHKLDIL